MKFTTLLFCAVMLLFGVYAQPGQAYKLLQNAEAQKGKPGYARLLHQADSAATDELDTKALINKKLGTYYYMNDAEKSLKHFQVALSYYRLTDDKPEIAVCLQNIAFIYDEQRASIPAAIPFAEQSLMTWQAIKDTLQMANMHKYFGLLLGKTSRNALAREHINTAIALYSAKSYEPGVAVSRHNMAIIFQYQKQYDSALAYLLPAKEYWQKNDTGRLFETNNLLLEINLQKNDLPVAYALYNENKKLYNNRLFWRDRLRFYALGKDYFEKAGDAKAAKVCLGRHDALYAEFAKKGLIKQ